MRCLCITAVVCTLLFLAQTGSSAAECGKFCVSNFKAAGHEIQISNNLDAGETKLVVDGKQMHVEHYIGIDEIAVVGSTWVIVGSSSGGGNACEATPFVLSLPNGEPARFDGPLETCAVVSHTIKENMITFEEPATPNYAGTSFAWTLDSGFTVLSREEFSVEVDKEMGWAELRQRDVQHPSDLLTYGEIASQIHALLGAHRKEYEAIIFGTGSGEFRGGKYIGRAWTRGGDEAFLIADITNRRVFLAWKQTDKPLEVRPKLSDWGGLDKGALSEWVRD